MKFINKILTLSLLSSVALGSLAQNVSAEGTALVSTTFEKSADGWRVDDMYTYDYFYDEDYSVAPKYSKSKKAIYFKDYSDGGTYAWRAPQTFVSSLDNAIGGTLSFTLSDKTNKKAPLEPYGVVRIAGPDGELYAAFETPAPNKTVTYNIPLDASEWYQDYYLTIPVSDSAFENYLEDAELLLILAEFSGWDDTMYLYDVKLSR